MPKIKSRALTLTISDIDYKKLLELSNEANMKTNEFLRTLIQVTYVASKGLDTNGKIEIGGYGITFPPDVLEEFSNRIAESFKNFDFEDFEKKVEIKPSERNYRPKLIA